jgi:hypothetical protein
MNIVLFSPSSLVNESPTFQIPDGGQLTIFAVGMQPGDYVTFEVLALTPGARPIACGCYITEAMAASILAVQELQCPTCESDTAQPVRLTDRNPVIVLDSPQGVMLRAVYHGDGVNLGLVTVTASQTDTPNLTDAMRGCPPVCCEDEPETWEDTGQIRCDDLTETVEVQQISNCGNFRWVAQETQPAVYWTVTGNIRCIGLNTEVQEVNPCGGVRWVAGGPVVWTATGNTRCSATNVENEERNQCGDTRWVVGDPLVWTATGSYDCINYTCRRQESNQCGGIRWIDTGEPCGESRHTITSIVCTGGGVEGSEVCWLVTLNGPVQGAEPLTIYFVLSGSEQVAHGYIAPVLVIPVGASSGTVCVVTADDAVLEDPTSLCIRALPSSRITAAPLVPVCCSITDDEAPPPDTEYTITNVTCNGPVVEGQPLTWTVTLDGPVSGSSLVLNTTLSGTEQGDHAYAAPTITILPGASSGQATINTVNDAVIDGTRSLCLSINAHALVTNTPFAPVCCDVLDNDAPDSTHTVSAFTCLGAVVEGGIVQWQITLDAPVSGNNLLVTGVLSGAEQVAHGYANPSVTIPVGSSVGVFSVTTIDDSDVEGDLDLCLTLNTSARLPVVPAGVCCSVIDNDTIEPTTYTVSIACPGTATEGDLVSWTITVAPMVADVPLSISFVLSGDETIGHSYTVSDNPLVVPVGGTGGVVTVQTDADSTSEPDRQLCLQALADPPRIPLASNLCCVTIENDDPAESTHTISSLTCDGPVEEGGTLCWTITLNSNVTGSPLTVNSTLSGSEQAVHGYAAPSVVIPIGSNTGQLCVNTTDDAVIESTLSLCLAINSNPRISGTPSAAVCCNVTDNDAEFGQAFGDMGGGCCNEDGPSGGNMPTYTVTFDPSGTITESDSCSAPVLHDPGWADGTFDPNDYDVRIIMTLGDPMGGPPNLGVWENLGSIQSFTFGGNTCAVTCTDVYAYNIQIALASDHGTVVASGSVGGIQLNRNNECL